MKNQIMLSTLLALLVMPVTALADDEASTGSNAYVTIEKYTGDGEQPVNPTDPNETVKPAPDTDGKNPHQPSTKVLSLNYVSNLQFGSQEANGNDAVYQVKPDRVINSQEVEIEVPNFVQITDHRGTNSGWTLMVKQDGAFKNGAHSLDGTELIFTSPVLSSKSGKDNTSPTANANFTLTADGKSAMVMSAATDQGMGTWVDYFGKDLEAAKTGIQLKIPGDAKKVAGFYQTSLTWTLTDTPFSE
ncbi:WxL domain-containing protein [Enterococcus termitis]